MTSTKILTLLLALCVYSTYGRNCQEKALEAREEEANVVLTGTVRELFPDNKHPYMYKGEVEIKRVIKGNNVVAKQKGHMDPATHHKMITVDGFGDPRICDSNVRKHDTRIFLLAKNGGGDLKLNSSLVRITLNNIDQTDAAVLDKPFERRPEPHVEPCEMKYCAYGAVCRVNATNNEAYCKCIEKCNTESEVVCGTDGVTYSSPCKMRQASCAQQKRIKVRSKGECSNPCDKIKCYEGAICMPSLDGKGARCQCQEFCESFGDHEDSKPVCGSDGNDYASLCELNKKACETISNITVKHKGKCALPGTQPVINTWPIYVDSLPHGHPCKNKECPESTVCQLDDERNPVCKCDMSKCSDEIDQVCASNGRTYSNKCIMQIEACKNRMTYRVQHKGPCKEEDSCAQMVCPFYAECVNMYGEVSCECPSCQNEYRPVCGSDGVTYDNECEMRRQSCLARTLITFKFKGTCDDGDICTKFKCSFGAECKVRNGMPKCECMPCSEEYEPVCGADGVSYTNECKLKQENCKNKKTTEVNYQGLCNGCEKLTCDFHSLCIAEKGKAKCVCPDTCILEYKPVCGTDGVTYENKCKLQIAACKKQQLIMVSSHGSCDKCKGVTCNNGAICDTGVCVCPKTCPQYRDVVCASNGVAYDNECMMQRAACDTGTGLRVVSRGDCSDDISGSGSGSGVEYEVCDETTCQYGGICDLDAEGMHGCLCDFNCPALRSPVCGSDGKLYASECELQEESCRKQQSIAKQSMDNCDGYEDQPCDGSEPLHKAGTNEEYYCELGYDTCPAGSYCHKGQGFAKCCAEEVSVKTCADSEHGCCPDDKTAAPGPNGAGCPSTCNCYHLGSYTGKCDPVTRQCDCKPGVGGLRCDRCEPGFWGLRKIKDGNAGCLPCECNIYGSVRDDCEQENGRCVCLPGMLGDKCDTCVNGIAGPGGCIDSSSLQDTCATQKCNFGAICQMESGKARCICDMKCPLILGQPTPEDGSGAVCGSDGQTYRSKCHLRLFSCRLQKDISYVSEGICRDKKTTRGIRSTKPTPEPMTSPEPEAETTPEPSPEKLKSSRKPKKTTPEPETTAEPESHAEPSPEPETTPEPTREPTTPMKPKPGGISAFCLTDVECRVSNTRCYGYCDCVPGFEASPNKTYCQEITTATTPVSGPDACVSQPCVNGGTCKLDPVIGYVCLCPAGKGGPICDEDVGFFVPAFSGQSYLELPFAQNALKYVVIELEFRSLNPDGLLVYNGQRNKDYISLALKDGYVEFRYNLGSGSAVIRSSSQIQLGKFSRVVVQRQGRDGVLKLDDNPDVVGKSKGSTSSLNLARTPFFLGGVDALSPFAFSDTEVSMGLVGCIQSFKVRGNNWEAEYDLMYPKSTDIIQGVEIGECGNNPCKDLPCNQGNCLMIDTENYKCMCNHGYTGAHCETKVAACSSEPCQNGGSCSESDDGMFQCKCPSGFEGQSCQTDLKNGLFVPKFKGNSFIERSVSDKIGREVTIEIWFMATEPDGVLFYKGQHSSGKGDYIALNLVDGYLHFKFNLGSGAADIKSPGKVKLNKWHQVVVKRSNKEGSMEIDGQTVEGVSKGRSSELNVGQPLYIGGYRSWTSVSSDAGVNSGFHGAIQRFYINGKWIEDLQDGATGSAEVGRYKGTPCSKSACLNGGLCIPMMDKYECRCTMGFNGKFCDLSADGVNVDRPVKFDGSTFLKFKNMGLKKQNSETENDFSMRFKTTSTNGLLLIVHKSNTVKGDYLTLAVADGKLELSYNLGKQSPNNLHVVKSSVMVNDGKWHTVRITRNLRKGYLKVDDKPAVTQVSGLGATRLDTDGELYIGGKMNLPSGLPDTYYRGFKGCMENVKIGTYQLHLVLDQDTHMMKPLQFCRQS